MRGNRNMVVAVRPDRAALAVGAILIACSGVSAEITNSLTIPEFRPAQRMIEDRVRDLYLGTDLNNLDWTREAALTTFDLELFRCETSLCPRDASADDQAGESSDIHWTVLIALRWDVLLLHESPQWAREPLLLFTIEPDGLADPVFRAVPTDAFDLPDVSGIRLVSY